MHQFDEQQMSQTNLRQQYKTGVQQSKSENNSKIKVGGASSEFQDERQELRPPSEVFYMNSDKDKYTNYYIEASRLMIIREDVREEDRKSEKFDLNTNSNNQLLMQLGILRQSSSMSQNQEEQQLNDTSSVRFVRKLFE